MLKRLRPDDRRDNGTPLERLTEVSDNKSSVLVQDELPGLQEMNLLDTELTHKLRLDIQRSPRGANRVSDYL